MKQAERYIYIVIIIILVAVIASGVTFIVLKDDNKNNVQNNDSNKVDNKKNENNNEHDNNENTQEILKDGIKLVRSEKNKDNIVQEYQVILNGKEKKLKFYFTYEEVTTDGNLFASIKGKYNDIVFYNYEKDNNLSNSFDKETINKEFNEKNFKIIKGKDNKNYLIIVSHNYDSLYTLSNDFLYIFNDDLKPLDVEFESYDGCSKNKYMIVQSGTVGYSLKNGKSPWYNDEFNVCNNKSRDCYVNVKITDNKIYYLVHTKTNSDPILEERVYTIDNGNLNYDIINSYPAFVSAGQAC